MQERFDSFLHYFFVVQHFQRFSEGGFNNPRPAWFYPVVLAGALLPWSLGWLVAARQEWWAATPSASARRLMVVWAVAITLFFSLPQSKLAGYILPAVPPLLYLSGEAVTALLGLSRRWRSAWRVAAAVAAIVCVAVVAFIATHADRSQANLARIIRERMVPGDDVYALDEYRYALIFEARLRRPLIVSGDWSPGAVASRDNWRRELADAAAFEPQHEWLVENSAVLARVCAGGTSWLVGNINITSEFPWLIRHAEKVASSGELALWRATGQSLTQQGLCPGKPTASSGATS
jgi:hypothetical protein